MIEKTKSDNKARSTTLSPRTHILLALLFVLAQPAQEKWIFIPNLGRSNRNGLWLGLPFYWNLAPNYDLLLTPIDYVKRGLQLNGLFRYLFPYAKGQLSLSYLNQDRAFKQFKQTTYARYPATPAYLPYLNQLHHAGNDRYALSWQNTSQFNAHWTSHININRVSDAYYFEDFGGKNLGDPRSSTTQLWNQVDIDYSSNHWQAEALVSSYQSLHSLNQILNPATDQYQRLPELDANGFYPNIGHHLQLQLNSQLVDFNYHSAFTEPLPTGAAHSCIHLQPGITLPYYFPAGYFIPQLLVDSMAYHLTHALPGIPRQSSRTLPIVDIDSGMYFDRTLNFEHHSYLESLEPELFYLYVPYKRQNTLPNFDTQLMPFSYDQLFSLNRFAGYDRLSNANQISLGVTDRFLDAQSGDEKLALKLGGTFYFQPPKVCLNNLCEQKPRQFSPLVGALVYHPKPGLDNRRALRLGLKKQANQ